MIEEPVRVPAIHLPVTSRAEPVIASTWRVDISLAGSEIAGVPVSNSRPTDYNTLAIREEDFWMSTGRKSVCSLCISAGDIHVSETGSMLPKIPKIISESLSTFIRLSRRMNGVFLSHNCLVTERAIVGRESRGIGGEKKEKERATIFARVTLSFPVGETRTSIDCALRCATRAACDTRRSRYENPWRDEYQYSSDFAASLCFPTRTLFFFSFELRGVPVIGGSSRRGTWRD